MKTNYVIVGDKKVNIGRITPHKKKILQTCSLKKEGRNFNGYGYSDWDYNYTCSKSQFKELKLFTEKKHKRHIKSDAEKREAWVKRLVKLTSIKPKEAERIAEEKEEYKQDQIYDLELRQSEGQFPSKQRDKLIKSIERSNPLRRIKDEEHAQAILAASRRHRDTDYESRLEEGRELAKLGDIDKSEVKDYAREQMT